MSTALVMEPCMIPLASTASVEAVQTDVQAGGMVNRVEALRAVLSVDGLVGSGRMKLRVVNVLASHFG